MDPIQKTEVFDLLSSIEQVVPNECLRIIALRKRFQEDSLDASGALRELRQIVVGRDTLLVERVDALSRSIFGSEIERAFQLPDSLDLYKTKKTERTWLCSYSPFSASDPDRSIALDRTLGDRPFESKEEAAAYGSLLGLLVGDAAGAPFEFSPWREESSSSSGFSDEVFLSESKLHPNRFHLKPGQWTDDSSMALCLADSLLFGRDEFDPKDLRLRFLNWMAYGYNNAFGHDDEIPGCRPSIGLGGTIEWSLREFLKKPVEYVEEGSWNDSGNGSIMRFAPVAIRFYQDSDKAMEVAYLQSKTTHKGEEAAECSRLLAYIISRSIRGEFNREDSALQKLEQLLGGFKSTLHSVSQLAQGKQETEEYCRMRNLNPADRNWSWKEPTFRFAESRIQSNAGYVGSYCMDCLAMALHCIATTKSFEDAVLKATTRGGDADTVGAVTGQIAGALYGADAIPRAWKEAILKWDGNSDIPLRVHRLMRVSS